MSEPKLAELIAMSRRATQGGWFAQYVGGRGWEVAWRKDAPICHMRWTDGLNKEVEQRIEDEAHFIAALVNWFRETYTKERA